MRVYELAKEAGINSSEFLIKLRKIKVDAKTANSVLTPKQVAEIRKSLGFKAPKNLPAPPKPVAPPPLPPAPPKLTIPTRMMLSPKVAISPPAKAPVVPLKPATAKSLPSAASPEQARKTIPAAPPKPHFTPVAPPADSLHESKPRGTSSAGPATSMPSSSAAPRSTVLQTPPPKLPASQPYMGTRSTSKPVPRQYRSSTRPGFRSAKGPPLPPAPLVIPEITPGKAAEIQPIKMPITVSELSKRMKWPVNELIRRLMKLGIMATMNQSLDAPVLEKLGIATGTLFEQIPSDEDKALAVAPEDDPTKLKLRPTVVTMMGHVDHGKTSLLDAIRKTHVTSQEAGGITQHIGAYSVHLEGRGDVTFLDTPGHAAFTAMRARGANVTDVVVLVVAADDGIMPQTLEAIDHARAADVPIVVAVNKCDLPSANVDKIKGQLQQNDLASEDWGGKTIVVPVSAKTGKGIPELLEYLFLEAELLELKANPDRRATGVVVESRLSGGRGSVATVLIQNGTLRIGDVVLAGSCSGRIKGMANDRGQRVKDAGPSMPVEISGLTGVPQAGDKFQVVEDERIAKDVAQKRLFEQREKKIGRTTRVTLEDLALRIQGGEIKELKIILKADTQGSVEALSQAFGKLTTQTVKTHIIHAATGAINESDVVLAEASEAVVIGFHVKPDSPAEELAEREGVQLRLYSIIYEAIEDVKQAMEGLLEPKLQEAFLGRAKVSQVFKISRVGTVAGCQVIKGKMVNTAKSRLIRDGIVLFEGNLAHLKRFKDDAREVEQGYECGITLAGYNDVQVGDLIESFRVEQVAQKL